MITAYGCLGVLLVVVFGAEVAVLLWWWREHRREDREYALLLKEAARDRAVHADHVAGRHSNTSEPGCCWCRWEPYMMSVRFGPVETDETDTPVE